MGSQLNPTDDEGIAVVGQKDEVFGFRLRSYQEEMVLESLRSNIIVAMDTGSGKTHIALARTAVELETCQPDQLVWFLAPTVALGEQQSEVFKANLPGYGVLVLFGRDDVDHWGKQSDWDGVFENVRIVISTHQVLLEALWHGFVKMSKLALIIFDEAHHCTGNHPANKILADFYHPYIHEGENIQLPRILGLSASPVQKAKASKSDLQKIEQNMNATARTPKINRSELLRFVHRPALIRIDYPTPIISLPPLVAALQKEFMEYDLSKDPYLVNLLTKHREGYDMTKQLQKVFQSQNTYCYQQLKGLFTKAKDMTNELGPSAAEWYLQRCLSQFDSATQDSNQQLSDWTNDEWQYLATILQRIPLPEERSPNDILQNLSPKIDALVDVLLSEASPNFTGLVFVEQRVWVAALSLILSLHPRVQGKFNVGTFIGSSHSSKRKTSIANYPEPVNQQETLDKFRAGKINLILATSVLEEGIDVTSCHLVICFERPKNLKSFVQRRGRARKAESKYFIFMPGNEHGGGRPPESWESLEEEMKRAYLDDERKIEEAREREKTDEIDERFYRIESTGALLTLDNAVQHLYHFCSVLTSNMYTESRPQFNLEDVPTGFVRAQVTLPLSVNPTVRTAKSLKAWITERMAIKDACFEAYVALHKAGLVNDNLLPCREEEEKLAARFQIADNTPSLVDVAPALDPWLVAASYQEEGLRSFHRTLLTLDRPGEESFLMVLLTPMYMPEMEPLTLYWNETTRYTVHHSFLPSATFTEQEIGTMQEITQTILQTIFSSRMDKGSNDFTWLLVPSDHAELLWSRDRLSAWNASSSGSQPASELLQRTNYKISEWGLASTEDDLRMFIPHSILQQSSESGAALDIYVQATRLPKRRDFLHPVIQHNSNDAHVRVEELDASKCLVERLPASYAVFALLTPSIMYRYEAHMIAERLRTGLLAPVELPRTQVPMILKAITSSVTGEESNYQRLEFLGDCILKFVASVHLMAENPIWSEGRLTGKKGRIVSNGFAARSALAIGLDQYILTKRFTGAKWRPRYISELVTVTQTQPRRKLSSKILADVIESLIGVSYISGGFTAVCTCICTLLPLQSWTSIPSSNTKLFAAAPSDTTITNLTTLESLMGYTFTKKQVLLEALTHITYQGPLASMSYERLEFLGDAVLDYIISKRLFAHSPELSHQTMHGIRTAMANAAFLAFRMFETCVKEERFNPSKGNKEEYDVCLWHFLRLQAFQLQALRDVALRQHLEVRERMLQGLKEDARFPWHLLALTDAPKFLSDIVESVIGAIYVDSRGSIEACEGFVRRLGILECLERILRDGVDCLHPKERLGHLAVEKKVQYLKVGKSGHGDGKSNESACYRVQVKVGGEDVGGVEEGLKRLNAETVAAWKAVAVLEKKLAVSIDEDVDMSEQSSGEGEWFDAEEGGVEI